MLPLALPLHSKDVSASIAETQALTASVACRTNALTAHLISPTAATGAKFVMLLAKLSERGSVGQPPKGVERCGVVLCMMQPRRISCNPLVSSCR